MSDTVNYLEVEGKRIVLDDKRREVLGDSIALIDGETNVYQFVGLLGAFVKAMSKADDATFDRIQKQLGEGN